MILSILNKKLIITITKNKMSLSTAHLAENNVTTTFSIERLGDELKKCPEILFAYVLGSGTSGVVKPKSDLDLAVYSSNNHINHLIVYSKICDVCEKILPGVRIDVGFLRKCEDPVYKFETIKGRLLFSKEIETWLSFYSNTAREYEHQMFHYRKQRGYRAKLAYSTG